MAEEERRRREERTRRSEDRLRALIRDICSGCNYSGAPTRSQNVVRAKG